jgi:V8-like Glu-specific endopeptidase
MSRQRLTGKRAVWLGMLSTPVLLVAAVAVIGVTAGSAGPSTTATPAATDQVASGPVKFATALGTGAQTLAQLRAYWTPERMANAKPYPAPSPARSSAGKSEGSLETFAQPSGELRYAVQRPDGSEVTGSLPIASSPNAMTEPYHAQAPFDRWEWFGRYLRNVPAGSPNAAISSVHKMFFTAAGGGDFVCSSSTIGIDGVWTAGHCVFDPGVGQSTNVFFCPSYDSAQGGVNPTAGCWGAEELWSWSPQWIVDGNLEFDFGGADATDTPVLGPQPGQIGAFTGTNGFAWLNTNAFDPFNAHYMAMGYPAAPPFNGGKIHVCASSLAYPDDSNAAAPGLSAAIGCDMTGGSSGGPWLLSFGKPGQIGGGAIFSCCNFLFGHNDWAHVGGGFTTEEMNSPVFNCRARQMFWAINDIAPGACP